MTVTLETPIPEPGTLALITLCLFGVQNFRRAKLIRRGR
jgi:hypothetical protein